MDRVSGLMLTALTLAGCVATPPEWRAPRFPKTDGGPPVFRPSPAAPWTGWDDALPPQVRWDRIRGWAVTPAPPVQLQRALDAFSGFHPTARLTAHANAGLLAATLTPPSSVPLEGPADVVEVVVGAPSAATANPATAPRLQVRLRDSAHAIHTVELGPVPLHRWAVLQALAPAALLQCDAEGRFGWIEAVELGDWNPAAVPEVRLASLAVGLRHAGLQRPPGPPDPPWRRSDPAELADARPPAAASVATVEPLEEKQFALRSSSSEGELTFHVHAPAWYRNIEVRWNGKPRLQWGGWRVEGAAVDLTPRSVVASDDRLELDTAGGWRVTMRLIGRTLSVRMQGPASAVSLVACGWSSTPEQWRRLPLLDEVPVAIWQGNPPIFGTAFFDPFRSSASRMGGASDGSSALQIARYEPADHGRAPAVDETFHLTVSPRVEEVIPSVPSVSGRRAADAATSVYFELGPLGTGRLREAWDALQAGPMLVLTAPAPGTPREDELDCTDPRWTREWARHGPDGRWCPGAAPGRYKIKTPWMATAHALAFTRAEPADRAWVPQIGDEPPWAFTDYDARSPGAAAFRTAWDGLANWYRLESQRRAAPVLCDAAYAWLYADAADGAVWNPARSAELIEGPWVPLVALLRLNRAIGLVAPPLPLDGARTEYRLMAAAIAHGMALRLPALDVADDRLWRWAFLFAALHRRQALQTVERIAWGTPGGSLCSPSAALAGEVYRHSRLYLRYRDGLEIWINGDTQRWTVAVGGDAVELPPDGWYASGPDLRAASTLVGGRRLDWVRAPEYAYHDGHGGSDLVDGLGTAEPVLVRVHERPSGRRVRLTFLRAASPVVLGPPFWPNDARAVRVAASDASGGSLAPPDPVREGDLLRLRPPAAARDIEFEWTR